MSRQKLSTQQLKDLYYKTTHGDNISEAARFLGLTEGNAYQAKQSLKKYMGWIMDGSVKNRKQLRKNYLIAAKWAIEQDSLSIKRPEPAIDPRCTTLGETAAPGGFHSEPAEVKQITHYDKLDLQFGIFKDAMLAYIAAEVEKQVGDIKADNERMKKMIDDARLGNFADALKQKWEGK